MTKITLKIPPKFALQSNEIPDDVQTPIANKINAYTAKKITMKNTLLNIFARIAVLLNNLG